MKAFGIKRTFEKVDVEIEKGELIRLIKQGMGIDKDYVHGEIYYEFGGYSNHNGDEFYDKRPATFEECKKYDAFLTVATYIEQNENV